MSRRRWSSIAAALAASALTSSACLGAAPEVGPAASPLAVATAHPLATASAFAVPAESKEPEPAKFDFDDSVPGPLRDQVVGGIRSARSLFGYSGPLTVYVSSSPEWIISRYVSVNQTPSGPPLERARTRWLTWGCMEAGNGAIFFKTTCMSSDSVAMKLAHEYFHTLQAYLTKKRQGAADSEIPRDGPRWLGEGSAIYAEIRYAESLNPAYAREEVARYRARASAANRPLRCLETWNGMNSLSLDQSYALGYVASDYLVSRSGKEAVYRTFWITQLSGVSWQDAFTRTFGLAVGDFYLQFEEYRQKTFPGALDTSCLAN